MNILKPIGLIIAILMLTGCVQKTHQKNITLMVDMTGIEDPSQVGVRGNGFPLSWNETTQMTDSNADGIFEITFNINTANNDAEFKFVRNDSIFELNSQDNRYIRFEYKPETIVYRTTFNNTEHEITKE